MTKAASPKDRLSATLVPDEPTTSISGVKEARGAALASMGLIHVRDVLNHFPIRYMDMTAIRTSATAQIGEQCTMAGIVHEIKLKKTKRRLSVVEISLTDDDGLFMVSVFNRAYLANQIMRGDRLILSGKVEYGYGFLKMINPYIEKSEDGDIVGKVMPIHHASAKISTTQMRNIVKSALKSTQGMFDVIPAHLRIRRGLVSRQHAFRCVHFPKSLKEASDAKKRLAYEELLLLQLFLMTEEHARVSTTEACAHEIGGYKLLTLEKTLPFRLTEDQGKAVDDLLSSMSSDISTSRMLLGDVGTGKTIVAAFGMACAADTGTQSLLCAPTEVLATQHHRSLAPLLEKASITCEVLTGSTPQDERRRILDGFSSGEIDVLIGTHAILEPDVMGRRVTFIAIDEQQRFGVGQREALLSKGPGADCLFMTATPIPRTLALTLFGGMGLSYLRERPNHGANRETQVLDFKDRGRAFDLAGEELLKGHQVYIVCPLIDPDESKDGNASSPIDQDGDFEIFFEDEESFERGPIASAKQEAEQLQESVFPEYNIGLLHGDLSMEQKTRVMDEFRNGQIDILVSTTMIEVGIDVPNATVMIIEDADRFGLSQLHQLRGRVGRGEHDAHVFLISSSTQPKALKRLKAMEQSDDGFEIAQYDLSLRREGDILGNRQSGSSSLKIVNIMRDRDLVEQAHEDAIEILKSDPDLSSRENAALAREMRSIFAGEKTRCGG